jgi:hypothetical protein
MIILFYKKKLYRRFVIIFTEKQKKTIPGSKYNTFCANYSKDSILFFLGIP